MYQIDVGGVSFHTQTEVLHEGMLAAMSSENFSNNLDHMFLDRYPTWFPLVLHFLRTGDALLPECTEELRALRATPQRRVPSLGWWVRTCDKG